MTVRARRVAAVILLLIPLSVSIGCRRAQSPRRGVQPARTLGTLAALDPIEAYRSIGLLTTVGPVSFVGNIRFLAGPSSDSALAIIAVSLPSRSLTFSREGDRYRAVYAVEFELLEKRPSSTTRIAGRFTAQEAVRVSTLRETARDEESILFQQFVVVPSGSYVATLTVRDLGANRSGTAEGSVVAPRFLIAPSALAASTATPIAKLAVPVIVHAAIPRASRSTFPNLIVNTRATAVFGRDSLIQVYLEWYGIGPIGPADRAPRARISVRADDGRQLHGDSITASAWSADGQVAAAIAQIPVMKLGLGRLRISASHISVPDTVSAPLFISASEDLAAVSLHELLDYLRYFTTAERLRVLRDTLPEARAATWSAFLRATDPSPVTPEHEGLREYFSRLAVANARFRGEEIPGWLSDRGMVYSTLGEPDRISEPRTERDRPRERIQLWEYTHHRLRLMFVEREGAHRWHLTPSSEAEFQAVAARTRR
jgi:GWxTD domain-containing protein